MAKSGKPRVSVLLLAVLVAAVSLHSTHRVTVAAGGAASMVAESFKKFTLEDATEALKETKKVVDAATEVIKVALKDDNNGGDERSAAGVEGDGSTKLIHNDHFPQLDYVRVTDIKVGGIPALFEGSLTLDINPDGSGGVLVSTNFPLTFLNGDAYQQLKRKVSDGRAVAKSDLGGEVDQPCYASGTPQPITVVFDGGDEMRVEADKCWYQQSDGSMCLAVLPSPWATGETIIGTMLQTGVNVGADKLTFQKSTKDGSGSGSGSGSGTPSNSKSNTAAATKPLLGVWVLLLLAYTIAC